MHRDVTRTAQCPPTSAKPHEIAQRCLDQERGRNTMNLYKPIVASVVVSLTIAGLAAAQEMKRPPSGSAPTAAAPAPAAPGAHAPTGGVPVGPEYKIGID